MVNTLILHSIYTRFSLAFHSLYTRFTQVLHSQYTRFELVLHWPKKHFIGTTVNTTNLMMYSLSPIHTKRVVYIIILYCTYSITIYEICGYTIIYTCNHQSHCTSSIQATKANEIKERTVIIICTHTLTNTRYLTRVELYKF